jgi:hypothetical protein
MSTVGTQQRVAHQSEPTRGFTLTDIIAVVGGSIGIVYLVGYLVLASHQRALGVSVRSTDAPVLIANAWEFGFRGSLITLITVIRWVTRALTNPWLLVFALLALIAVIAILRKRPRLAARFSMPRHIPPVVLVILVVATSVSHLALNTVPLTGIQDLLFSPTQVSPFANLPNWIAVPLTRRLAALQSSLTENSSTSDHEASADPERRANILTSHVALTLLSLAIYMILRKQSATKRVAPTSRRLVLVVTILHALFAPIFYGVLLKSYRYPRVQITVTPTNNTEIDRLYADYPYAFPFLLEATDDDLYLYFPTDRQITVIRRDTLAQFRIIGGDSVLGTD